MFTTFSFSDISDLYTCFATQCLDDVFSQAFWYVSHVSNPQ